MAQQDNAHPSLTVLPLSALSHEELRARDTAVIALVEQSQRAPHVIPPVLANQFELHLKELVADLALAAAN